MDSPPGEVTELLIQMRSGKREVESKLIPLVYAELRRLAAHYLRGERGHHTLQPTALVHEAYLRLINLRQIEWQNRAHFFAISATLMRRILVDHARAQRANKRDGSLESINLDTVLVICPSRSKQLLDLDDALNRLGKLNPRGSRIVELRFFGGLTEEETGTVLGISSRTVKREWRLAKAWLYNEVNQNVSVEP